jgi:hypothetical protein
MFPPILSLLIAVGFLFWMTVPMVKMLVKGLRQRRFDNSKLSNAHFDDNPLAFCMDALWVSGWVWVFLGLGVILVVGSLSKFEDLGVREWVEATIATPTGRTLLILYATPVVIQFTALPTMLCFHFGPVAVGAIATGKLDWDQEKTDFVVLREAPVRFVALLVVAIGLTSLGLTFIFWILRAVGRYFGLV